MGFKISQLKTDLKRETEGAWVDYRPGVRLRIARVNNPNYDALLRKLGKPYRSQLRREDLAGDVLDDIVRKVFAETVLLDWEGIEDDDGKPVPYSKEQALAYLTDIPDFYRDVQELAGQAALFRIAERDDSVGN